MKVKIKVLQTPNSLDPESRKARCMEYGLEGMVNAVTGEPVDGIVPNRYTVRWLPEGCPLTFVPQNGEPQSITPDADGTVYGIHLNDLGMKRAGDYFGVVIRDILASPQSLRASHTLVDCTAARHGSTASPVSFAVEKRRGACP